jgi:hypothetical protein
MKTATAPAKPAPNGDDERPRTCGRRGCIRPAEGAATVEAFGAEAGTSETVAYLLLCGPDRDALARLLER